MRIGGCDRESYSLDFKEMTWRDILLRTIAPYFSRWRLRIVRISQRNSKKVQDQASAAKNDVDQGDEDVYDPEGRKTHRRRERNAQVEDLADNEADNKFLPSEMNENVQKWINYFQGKGRKHMVRYLSRSTRYIPR